MGFFFCQEAIIALAGALILSNLKIIPTESPVYDAVWAYLVPLAIPLLLFQVNMKELFQEKPETVFYFLLNLCSRNGHREHGRLLVIKRLYS